VIGGAGLALAVVLVARRSISQRWILLALAVGLTATAELLIEVVEYPLLYSGRIHVTAYYDTIADLASTLVGAIVGAALSIPLLRTRR
jgi:hypothetical protein